MKLFTGTPCYMCASKLCARVTFLPMQNVMTVIPQSQDIAYSYPEIRSIFDEIARSFLVHCPILQKFVPCTCLRVTSYFIY